MLTREDPLVISHPTDLILRGRPNWTVIVFFAGLGGLHLIISVAALATGHWEGYLSLVLGGSFALASLACYGSIREIAVLAESRTVRLRTGLSRFRIERCLPFDAISGVRVTYCEDGDPREAVVELMTERESIECPRTMVPRQQALCLAVLINTPLTKVSYGQAPARPLPRENSIPVE